MRLTFRQVIAFLILLGSAGSAFSVPERAVGTDSNLSAPREFIHVDEWPVAKPEDAPMPKLDKAQLITEVEKLVNKYQTIRSWEAKYNVTFRHSLQKQRDITIPEIIISSQVHTISNGSKWLHLDRKETKLSTASVRIASDGRVVRMILPDVNQGQIKHPSQHRVSGNTPTLVNFLPYLRAESCLTIKDFPEVLEILNDPDTKLLPWYARLDGRTCYVLERTTKREKPILRASQQAANWKKENPKEASSPLKIRVDTTKTRLAIDPELDFAIVRWALGIHTELPGLRFTTFPLEEIIYGDFRQVADGINIPWKMTHTPNMTKKADKQTQVELEEFAVDRQYDPGLFEIDFPDGYEIMDTSRAISYTEGDSKEQIDALVAAVRRRAAFYDSLRNKEAPALEASQWFNTTPISLAEQKGRAVILHFWAIYCAPCMYELPQLQKQYGQTLKRTSGPLFISIHSFVDGDELKQLENIIEKKGITFPVMVDSPGTERLPWGKTFNKYRVFGIPTEVKIDENGHFVEIDKGAIATGSQWLKKSEINNSVTTKEK